MGADHPLDQTARSLYTNSDPASAPAKTGDDATTLYGYSTLTGAIERRGAELWAQTGANAAVRQETLDTFVGIAKATGLPEGLLATIADQHISGQLAAARPTEDPDAADAALSIQIAQWNEEARDALRQTYGAKDGEALLERTRRWVRSHPPLAKILQRRGIGSRPDIAAALAAHVFSKGIR